MRILVLGATGRLGRLIVSEAVRRGHEVRAQTRRPGAVEERAGVEAVIADPTDAVRMQDIVAGCGAVIFALGVDTRRPTTLFSDATRALLPAMTAAGVLRLVAITGVGAGETRGHGGWLYDRVIFPLFTRNRYADKERQEALIRASDRDWVILRPAPFTEKAGAAPLQFHDRIAPDLRLTGIAREEAARCALDAVEGDAWLRKAVFVGRP